MQAHAYLNFNGNCEEAFSHYAQILGGQIVAMMPHAGSPMEEHVPADWGKAILHARMIVGDTLLMGSDSPPNYYEKPQGFSVTLMLDTIEEADRVFAALADGGTASMPIAETFWALRFGMLVDKYGTPWMVTCEKAIGCALS